MGKHGDGVYTNSQQRITLTRFLTDRKGTIYFLVGLTAVCIAWYFAANAINRSIVLPYFPDTMKAFFNNWTNAKIMHNLAITLARVFRGFFYALMIGLPLGLVMGYSKTFMEAMTPLINSIRQVPIMAWVPLAIIWFGLGEGPTVFLITVAAVFPIMLNTMAGVMSIDPNYKHAARSMGASTAAIFRDVIFPGALPSFLMGCRLALGLAWMSVICAEFIATNSGFGFLMVEAQVRMWTADLYSLMIMSALVGYFIDRLLLMLEKSITSWRFRDAAFKN